ncbi:unnamed protein product [Larinioides sclopetarius]|uniref:BPTI/Kunitz inhibitor domain-containing protein n=2 Tax=Larinioides sclopetarius TaxID=280406 RepID=A0AAV2BSN5_9ARAC
MMLFFIFVLLAVAFARKEKCDEHSHYHACGTSCPETCENYRDPFEECIYPCSPGCHCDPGFIKAKTGKCVRPENCPRTDDVREKNCFEPPKKGLCKDSLSRWYYDSNSGQCREFIYGGCEGNGNSYMTFHECMEYCAVDCYAKPDPGQCYTNMPRYYYDDLEEACKLFIYGGCGGNTNNFVTIEECYGNCGKRTRFYLLNKYPYFEISIIIHNEDL